MLGVPSSGSLSDQSATASFHASLNHQIHRQPSFQSGPNFNACWCAALNAAKRGLITHHAQMHTDLTVVEREEGKRWLDILAEEMDEHDLDFISVPMSIKDHRGVTSSGIGDPFNRWTPFRRWTVVELGKMPATFTAEDVGYGDKFLLHNNALCLWDMRKPIWFEPGDDGFMPVIFNFTEQIVLHDGEYRKVQESEDWAFSRTLWKVGARTALTRRIRTIHHGSIGYPNWEEEGEKVYAYRDGDEDTAANWRTGKPEEKNGQSEKKVLIA